MKSRRIHQCSDERLSSPRYVHHQNTCSKYIIIISISIISSSTVANAVNGRWCQLPGSYCVVIIDDVVTSSGRRCRNNNAISYWYCCYTASARASWINKMFLSRNVDALLRSGCIKFMFGWTSAFTRTCFLYMVAILWVYMLLTNHWSRQLWSTGYMSPWASNNFFQLFCRATQSDSVILKHFC